MTLSTHVLISTQCNYASVPQGSRFNSSACLCTYTPPCFQIFLSLHSFIRVFPNTCSFGPPSICSSLLSWLLFRFPGPSCSQVLVPPYRFSFAVSHLSASELHVLEQSSNFSISTFFHLFNWGSVHLCIRLSVLSCTIAMVSLFIQAIFYHDPPGVFYNPKPWSDGEPGSTLQSDILFLSERSCEHYRSDY